MDRDIKNRFDALKRHFETYQYPDGTPVYKFVNMVNVQPTCVREPLTPSTLQLTLPKPWIVEPEAEPAVMADTILARGGALIQGPPGSGKTWKAHRIMEAMKGKGEVVHPIAFTHAAARNFGGYTVSHHIQAHQHKLPAPKSWTALDEVSMISTKLLGTLARFLLVDGRFIVLGDFDQQLPIYDAWGSESVLRYYGSDAFKQMCGHTVYNFGECRRAQGPSALAHFTWYCGLPALTDGRLSKSLLKEAQERFPWNLEQPDIVLCLSHDKRETIALAIALQASADRRSKGLPVKIIYPDPNGCKGAPMNPHANLHLWPGLEMVGCRRSGADRNHIENGCLYTVKSIDDDSVVVELSPSMVLGEAPPHQITLSDHEAGQLLRYNFARTVAGCQGLTFADKRVLLLDTESRFFCRRKLYVATSRCTNPGLFHIPFPQQEARWLSLMEQRATALTEVVAPEMWTKPVVKKRPVSEKRCLTPATSGGAGREKRSRGEATLAA